MTESKRPSNERKMMELAVKVMGNSISEPRDDDKASPKVGAVLVKTNGDIETACRGELRYGDHAEYTLLERKNRGSRLEGAVLFTTLEPCAPGSRHHPKLSCAERIQLARIAKVWVGVVDRDPKVDRKGIEFLRKAGIEVEMFDRDLQETILTENKKYFSEALERAAEAKRKIEPVPLSPLEGRWRNTETGDFSNEALEQYRKSAGIKDSISSVAFTRRLILQGVLTVGATGDAKPTGFGVLLFGREPRLAMPQAGLLATIRYPSGSDETRDFDGPAVLVPDALEKWLRDKLPNVIDRNQMQRREIPALPFELVREAVVNALVHRDYAIAGGKCQLVVTEDTVTIRSPGAPIPPITLEQMQTFNAPMLSRNPQLHYVFARMELAEERGMGLRSMKERAEKLGLPLPKYTFDDPYVVLTLFRTAEGATMLLPGRILEELSKDEKVGWQFVASKTTISAVQYARHMKYTDRQARRHLRKFADLGLLRRTGAGPYTEYHVVRP